VSLLSVLPVLSEHASGVPVWSNGDLWSLINFVLLVVLLVRFGGAPIKTALEARRLRVADEVDQLERGLAEAQSALGRQKGEADAGLAQLAQIGAGARAMAESLAVGIRAEAQAEAARIKASAASESDRIRRSFSDEVRRRLVEAAFVRAEAQLASRLGPEHHAALFDDFSAKVAEVTP